MEIVRAAMGLDPTAYEIDTRLLEITFGELEGFTYQEIETREPGWLAARDADKWGFLPPGGESYRHALRAHRRLAGDRDAADGGRRPRRRRPRAPRPSPRPRQAR